MIHCGTPCFCGVSDLSIPNTGAGMMNVSTHNNKPYIAVASNGDSPPNMTHHMVSVPSGHWSLSGLCAQLKIKLDEINIPTNCTYTVTPNNTTNKITISQASGTGQGFRIDSATSLLTAEG